MSTYQHLNLEERELLSSGLTQGKSLRQIGKQLGRSHTSLSRELKRNRLYGNRPSLATHPYLACKAEVKAQARAREQRRKAPLKHPFIFVFVRKHLREDGWSPETIAGRLRLEYPRYSIHHETIYRYVYRPEVKRRFHLHRYLTLARKTRRQQDGRSPKRQPKIINPVSIDFRPQEANLRLQPGHWETDNPGGKLSDRTSVSVTEERLFRYSLIAKLVNRLAVTKTTALTDQLSPFPPELKLTMTGDNGSENADHQQLARNPRVSYYFCHPYHSWEKGAVENTIGRLRRFLPKGTSLDQVSVRKLEAIQHWLNHTPRKCLAWKTPHEALSEYLIRRGYSTDFLAP